MKKLIIMLATVAVAAITQAASVSWSLSNFDPVPGVDGTGTWSGTATLAMVGSEWSTTVDVVNGDFMIDVVIESDYNTDYDFTISATDASGAIYSGTGFGSTDNFGTGFAGFDAGTWTPVPEPTSGLLMLLGVAGLALKRKRA